MFIELEVRKWGNSYGLRLNKTLAELLKVQEGDRIRLNILEDKIELSKAPADFEN